MKYSKLELTSNTDKHLFKARSRCEQERDLCFAGDGSGEHRFTGTGRTGLTSALVQYKDLANHQQNTLRKPSTKSRELLRVLEEIDNLFQFLIISFVPDYAVEIPPEFARRVNGVDDIHSLPLPHHERPRT